MLLGLADGESSGFVRADCTAMEITDGVLREKALRSRELRASDCLLRLDIDAVELMRPGDMYTASNVMDGCGAP